MPQSKLSATLRELFDFRPAGIIKTLNLKRPIYQPTAAYGHFGRIPHDGLFPWERLDMAETSAQRVRAQRPRLIAPRASAPNQTETFGV